MKKFFAIAAMAVAAMTASAQAWVGGEFCLDYSKDKDADNGTTQFMIMPEIGYDLDETMSVACALGYGHYELNNTMSNTLSITPYVRYNFAKFGAVKFFVDGGVSFASTHTNGVEDNLNSFGVALRPGLSYGFCEKAGLVAHIGSLGWDHIWAGEASANNFNLEFTNAIAFGIYFNL